MISSGNLVRSALVAIVLVAVVESGSADQKLATCCKTVSRNPITEPITGFMVQQANLPCVKAVIFQTKSGLYCSQLNAKWVPLKIREFMKAKAQSTLPPKVSLLSIITSSASPSSSSAPLPSSALPSSALPSSALPSSALPSISSTSEMPADETSTSSSHQ
ncbi:uncharacterized protein LOC128426079 isoform X2 [Pleuronectes platessa]|uniref:uncharacterized protein LOC128426079 isoform X2 n=1 Tax=Pleuronectes platessa TaxID=8262 RepID=UPI00232A1BDB|nr:uncharacterized protein LOC128426079 isoform X2 [Pleuronectes platessa]